MSAQRTSEAESGRTQSPEESIPASGSTRWTTSEPGSGQRRPTRPRSLEEAQAAYITARDAWTDAMRRASSGRSADLASLAIAQETYEAAVAERDRWESGRPVAVPIEPEPQRSSIDVVVGQQIAWRRVQESGQGRPSFLGRLARRLTGRD